MGRRKSLELAISEISILRRDSAENRVSDRVFRVHDLLDLGNDRFRLLLRDDDYAVDIGEDKIASSDLERPLSQSVVR